MQNGAVKKYVLHIIDQCSACSATDPSQPNWTVSISSLSQLFNNVFCTYHFYLDSICVFHAMDNFTRYSSAQTVNEILMNAAVLSFESFWMNQFWEPAAIMADSAFLQKDFRQYYQNRGIKHLRLPPGRHSNNTIESKHGIAGSMLWSFGIPPQVKLKRFKHCRLFPFWTISSETMSYRRLNWPKAIHGQSSLNIFILFCRKSLMLS